MMRELGQRNVTRRQAAVMGALRAALRPRASLVAENLLLRQQLAIFGRTKPRRRLRPIDRAFWILVSRLWSRWAECLAIVQPATVIAWHRRGFARFWAWKSRPVGRPRLAPELVSLIEQMARENPLLDHLIVLGERHLLRLVRQHVAYYNEDRPYMSLDGDAPVARAVEPPSAGAVVSLPRVGGLHHRYSRAA